MLVKLENISKTYGQDQGKVEALKDVTFQFDKSQFITICGPSGSGKTTMLTIMAGLHHPTAGKVIVDDISIYDQLDSDGLAAFRSEYVGFVFQSFYLIPYLTAQQNIMLPLAHMTLSKNQKLEMAYEALKKVGLEDRANHLPSELSGGQCQRVAIARALVNQPMLIFADEPTGNLDSSTRDDILDLFSQICEQGHSIIMVTHDPDNIKKADRTIRILDGKI